MQAAILAGGGSRRFGSPKAEIPVGDESLLERTSRVLREALSVEPTVITEDLRPGNGPLGGIETVLSACDSQVIVVACDMPGLDPKLIELLASYTTPALVVLPWFGGQLHPLCARWDRRALVLVQHAIDRGERAIHRVLSHLGIRMVSEVELSRAGIDARRALWNVNEPGDLDEFAG